MVKYLADFYQYPSLHPALLHAGTRAWKLANTGGGYQGRVGVSSMS